MVLLQAPLIHDDLFHESSECTIQQWPAHLAKDMADTIHRNVGETLRQSRLIPRMDGIQLVQRHDIVNVERILGSGAFSQVSSVFTRDGRRYACKHLKQTLMGHLEEFRTAAVELVYEAHMLASFDHPNILKIRGWALNGVKSFEEGFNDSFFLLLDVLDETLDMRIERWQREQQEGLWSIVGNASTVAQQFDNRYLENLRVMSELASALDYIHQRGVIFRDAKPQNIGFLGDRVQLFDFGLSREIPLLDTSVPFEMSGKVGTLRYMAPEVATNQAYGVSADVYSWAMVSYEMLALEKPFDGWTREMHANIVCMQGRRPDTIGCSQPIPIILDHAWNANPAARPTLAQFLTQLEFLEEQQLRKVQEQQFQLNVSRQMETELQYPHLSTANPSQLSLIHVDMNYYLAAPAPKKRTQRTSLDDSIETIETSTLTIESQNSQVLQI
jgi:serine/threonine protein kinase